MKSSMCVQMGQAKFGIFTCAPKIQQSRAEINLKFRSSSVRTKTCVERESVSSLHGSRGSLSFLFHYQICGAQANFNCGDGLVASLKERRRKASGTRVKRE